MINKSLYRNLPHISTKMQQMGMRLAEHYCPHENELQIKLSYGSLLMVRSLKMENTYIDNLIEDTG